MARKVPPLPPVPPSDVGEFSRPTNYGGVFEATAGPRDVARFLGPPSKVVTEKPQE